MPVSININKLSLAHKGSEGISSATLPDVCLTPPIPIPVAYGNTSFSSDLAKGTKTVFADGGNMIAIKGSEFSKSICDEPGTVGGVISGVNMKESTWMTYSPDVFIEGQNACRFTDKKFHNHYNTVNAAGEIQKPLPGSTAVTSPIDCEKAWEEIDKETEEILSNKDPIMRNNDITKAYAQLYQNESDLKWAGLASLVSRQAGCAMRDAKSRTEQWVGGGDAKVAYEGLAMANKEIFADIYPVMRFYEKHGIEGIRKCTSPDEREIPPELEKALEKAAQGDTRGAADLIAEFEQIKVVQDKVYADPAIKEVFAKNQKHANAWYSGVAGWFGARKPEISLSVSCQGGTPIPFVGDINSATDRVQYYQDLMNEFERLNGTPNWGSQTFQELILTTDIENFLFRP